MSQSDRDKWNARYEAGAYADRRHPSALLERWLEEPGSDGVGRTAVDMACGLGRNALHLARLGWEVTGVDVSDVALQRLRQSAAAEGLAVTCVRADLEDADSLPQTLKTIGPVDLALVIRYANLPLIGHLRRILKPGGYLVVEAHRVTDADVVGPRDPRFRVAPGQLREAATGMEIVSFCEGLVEDPDGRVADLARLIARRRP